MEADEYLDHSSGNGSLDKEQCYVDANALTHEDGRSEMETTFNADEGEQGILMSDGKRRPWQYLYKQHENHYSDDSSERHNEASIRRDASTFCNQVDCSTHQHRRVLYYVDELSLNEFGSWSVEKVICALIAQVCNVDDRWIQRESLFLQLLHSLDTDKSEIKRVRRTVQCKIEGNCND